MLMGEIEILNLLELKMEVTGRLNPILMDYTGINKVDLVDIK